MHERSLIINNIFDRNLNRRGRFKLLEFGKSMELDLDELLNLALKASRWLADRNINPGDTIIISGANSLTWIVIDLAAKHRGVIVAGMDKDFFMGNEELIADLNIRHIFLDFDYVSQLHPICRFNDLLENLNTIDAAAEDSAYEFSSKDIFSLKFTSGSTGNPKCLEATAESVSYSIQSVQKIFNHTNDDSLLVFLPLSLLQQRYWIYSALLFDHDVVLTNNSLVFMALKKFKPSVVMGVPGFYKQVFEIINLKMRDTSDLSAKDCATSILGENIRYLWTGSAPCDLAVINFFADIYIPLYEGYGMNEVCIVSKNYPGHSRPGSVGKLLDYKKAIINENSELIIYSEYPVNNKYKISAPGESERTFVSENCVSTGDLAYLDEDGYLFITGRVDDLIVLDSGKKVPPSSIESRLANLEGVAHAVLYGMHKPFLTALISLEDSSKEEFVIEQVSQFNNTVSSHERIGKLSFTTNKFTVANGYLTNQFKVRRKVIINEFKEQLENLYHA
ncbi:AMP-binding protein [Pseudomonas sp. FP1742]|uniref:AMP-binding protein n=1 Tax=Pseudomonas sp. FP1742 TaxID=2954079 RepID=UPI002733BEE4|nr:AMP-binding protein [Pseudomonas sp. FP1742]WLG48868.1 AMP-binding protein [Pseudomonas sp. FP1742]